MAEKSVWMWAAMAIAVLAASCAGPGSAVRDSGPRLVQDVTLPPPTTPWQTSAPVAVSTATPAARPTEALTPIQIVTIDSGFVFVTPTLPPSKTPTVTPTQSRTPTATPAFPTALAPTVSLLLPDSVFATSAPPLISVPPVNQPFTAVPPASACSVSWFFASPLPPACPLNAPLSSAAAALRLQFGYMVWVQEQSAVYVLYDDLVQPAWEVFPDRFADGMPERDDALTAPDNLWQPKRGFGLVWRTYAQTQRRLGWALHPDEEGFTTQVQIGSDGTVYVKDPQGGVFALAPAGANWQRYQRAAG